MDVVFYEVFREEREALEKFPPKDIRAQFFAETIQESEHAAPPAPLVSVRTQSRIPPSWAPQIKGILTRSRGYDHLTAYCRETGRNIPCGYLDNYCARAVAEQSVLMMMALLRRLKKQMHSLETFSRDGLTGGECRGRRALVVGVGHIGAEIVDIVRGLKMEVCGVDPKHNLKDLKYVSLEEGLPWADAVFCACDLNEGTAGMLGYPAWRQTKLEVLFVNIARGEISPVEDMSRLLAEGKLGGLAMDVYDEEDALAQDLRMGEERGREAATVMSLKGRGDVVFTPHNAFNTREALEQKARLSVASVEAFLKSGMFPLPVPLS